MLETPHAFVGAAIAVAIPNPFIAIPLAFASHFVLEMVPHWNPHLHSETEKYGHPTAKSTKIVVADSLIALIGGSAVAASALPNFWHGITILLACFASVLPDLIEAPYFFLKIKNKMIEKWINFQRSIQSDTAVVPGLITQLITILAAIVWIKH